LVGLEVEQNKAKAGPLGQTPLSNDNGWLVCALYNLLVKIGGMIVNNETSRKSCLRAGARWLLFAAIGLLATGMYPRTTDAQSAKIAATPPMGWNSWTKFG